MPQTETLTGAQKAKAVQEHAAHANGATHMQKHPLSRSIYTSGVHFMADICGAYWLIDAVLSHQHTASVRREPFQIWQLRRKGGAAPGWLLECWTDTPGSEYAKRIALQAIGYSDFPDELLPFKLYHEGGVLMLPQER